MIGKSYWTTGITVNFWRCPTTYMARLYSVSLNFHDHGVAQEGSTVGKLSSQYYEVDLGKALDTLIADAQRLGIVFDRNGEKLMLYTENDGEGNDHNRPHDWLEQLQAQARRLGWTTYYMDEDAVNAAEEPAAS